MRCTCRRYYTPVVVPLHPERGEPEFSSFVYPGRIS
jgi:hypothetical protein